MPEAAPAVQQELPPKPRFELPVETAPEEAPAAEGEPKVAQDPGKQAPPTEPEAKPEEALTPEQAAKREGRRFERRLDKAYRQRAEAQAMAELLGKRLAELEKSGAPQQQAGKPTLEQFEFDAEKYAAATAEYAKSQATKDFEAKQRVQTAQQARQRLIADWEEKADRAIDKYDDFQQVVGNLEPNSPFVAAIMEAENGEDIAYHLGKHLAEARRIASLSPVTQIREIGKLEAKLQAEPVKPKAPSKAPAPITPVSGAAQVATDVPSESDDYPTWLKKRQKQLGLRR